MNLFSLQERKSVLSAKLVNVRSFLLQEWVETNEGSFLFENLYKALDEVSLSLESS